MLGEVFYIGLLYLEFFGKLFVRVLEKLLKGSCLVGSILLLIYLRGVWGEVR